MIIADNTQKNCYIECSITVKMNGQCSCAKKYKQQFYDETDEE